MHKLNTQAAGLVFLSMHTGIVKSKNYRDTANPTSLTCKRQSSDGIFVFQVSDVSVSVVTGQWAVGTKQDILQHHSIADMSIDCEFSTIPTFYDGKKIANAQSHYSELKCHNM